MQKINENELFTVVGGASLTSAVLNALSKAADIIGDFGRAFGSALRRLVTGTSCKI